MEKATVEKQQASLVKELCPVSYISQHKDLWFNHMMLQKETNVSSTFKVSPAKYVKELPLMAGSGCLLSLQKAG